MLIFRKYLAHRFFLLAFIFLTFSVNGQQAEKFPSDSLTAELSSVSSASAQENINQPKAENNIIPKTEKESSIKHSLTNHEININKGKTSFKFKYGGRIQTRFDVTRIQEEGAEMVDKLYLRRIRFKSDGHLFTPKLGYKLEVDLLGGEVLDAFLKWNFYKNFEIWAGQTKLRGNRERVVSSQNLQFVDRSLLNSQFTLDRDLGFWLMHHFDAGNAVFREAVSVSKGEGRSIFEINPMGVEKGLDYTGRLEYLPFGEFKKNGDYSDGDLEREPKPKLSIGVTFDYNENAVKSRGHIGSITTQEADLRSWIADMMFKYRGFSVLTEYVDRKIYNGENLEQNIYIDLLNNFYTGNAFNTQAGYLFKRNYEIAARYTQVRPQSETINNAQTQYTFALSKYIVGHSIKAQTDFSILQESGQPNRHIWRLQFELSF